MTQLLAQMITIASDCSRLPDPPCLSCVPELGTSRVTGVLQARLGFSGWGEALPMLLPAHPGLLSTRTHPCSCWLQGPPIVESTAADSRHLLLERGSSVCSHQAAEVLWVGEEVAEVPTSPSRACIWWISDGLVDC